MKDEINPVTRPSPQKQSLISIGMRLQTLRGKQQMEECSHETRDDIFFLKVTVGYKNQHVR